MNSSRSPSPPSASARSNTLKRFPPLPSPWERGRGVGHRILLAHPLRGGCPVGAEGVSFQIGNATPSASARTASAAPPQGGAKGTHLLHGRGMSHRDRGWVTAVHLSPLLGEMSRAMRVTEGFNPFGSLRSPLPLKGAARPYPLRGRGMSHRDREWVTAFTPPQAFRRHFSPSHSNRRSQSVGFPLPFPLLFLKILKKFFKQYCQKKFLCYNIGQKGG